MANIFDPNPEIEILASKYDGEFHYGERLMVLEKGGEIVHEMLRLFLGQETAYLFKIDPDTCIVRPFHGLPDSCCVFGTLQHQGELLSIQGGCIGFTLDTVHKFYSSKFFLNPELGKYPPPWVITEALLNRPNLGLTSIDWVVGWACRMMDVDLVDWPEIMSEWKVTPDNEDLRYAVTHPHKLTPSTPGVKPGALRYWKNVSSVTDHQISYEQERVEYDGNSY